MLTPSRALHALIASIALFGAPQGAAQSPDGPPIIDRHGDPLPPGAVARLGTTRFRHGNNLNSVAYSPDGKWIASANYRRGVFLFDAASGRRLHTFAPFATSGDVVFSSDGRYLASATCTVGDIPILVWDPLTGREVCRIPTHSITVGPITFSPDNQFLAWGRIDGWIHVWEIAAKKEVRAWQGHKRGCDHMTVVGLAFSPDGKNLASVALDGSLHTWDWAVAKSVRQVGHRSDSEHPVALSLDGKLLISWRDDALLVCDVATGKSLRKFAEKMEARPKVAFSHDGTLLATLTPGVISLLETSTGRLVRKWAVHPEAGLGLAFAPDGKTLVTTAGSALRRWEVATGKELHPGSGHFGTISAVRFSTDGRHIISAAGDGGFCRWNADDGTLESSWTASPTALLVIQSPVGKHIADVSYDEKGTVRWWPAGGGGPLAVGELYRRVGYGPLSVSPDSRFLAWLASDETIRVLDTRTYKELARVKDLPGITTRIIFSPEGTTLAAVLYSRKEGDFSYEVRLVNWKTGTDIRSIRMQSIDQLDHIVFSPDGRWLGHAGKLWWAVRGQDRVVPGRPAKGSLACFSKDGRLQAWGGRGTEGGGMSVVETATGREVVGVHETVCGVRSAAFSLDGRRLVLGYDDSTLLVWDLTGGQLAERRLARPDLETCWAALASEDAAVAYRAVWSLVASPRDSLSFLRRRLHPIPPHPPGMIDGLIRDLDTRQFDVRNRAVKALEELAEAAEPALNEAEGKASLEARRRIAPLLNKLADPKIAGAERLRAVRCVAVLESLGTSEAVGLLEALAGGGSGLLTREAQLALRRLSARSAAPRMP